MLRSVPLVLLQMALLSSATLAPIIAQPAPHLRPTALLAPSRTLIPTFNAFPHALLALSKTAQFVSIALFLALSARVQQLV